jgi:predicted acylesterase/phospholipase RssA
VQPYSPERRTALVLCGTGAHGAYHAGVLRALQEAGVKIDVMAGQGIGAAAAALAAIDGGARLWDPSGVWRSPGVGLLYRWKRPLQAADHAPGDGTLVVAAARLAG